MERIPKFKINDIVYTVNDFKIGKSIVKAIVYVELEKGTQLNYQLLCSDKKMRTMNEAYIVETLDEAKEAAKKNIDNIHNEVINSLNFLKEEDLAFKKEEEQSNEPAN